MKIFSIVTIIVAVLGIFCGLSAVVCGIAELGQQGAVELIIEGLIVIFLGVPVFLDGIHHLCE